MAYSTGGGVNCPCSSSSFTIASGSPLFSISGSTLSITRSIKEIISYTVSIQYDESGCGFDGLQFG